VITIKYPRETGELILGTEKKNVMLDCNLIIIDEVIVVEKE
jgi:hypothetical protein